MSKQQSSLFDTDPAPWELDDGQMRLVATVVLVSGPDGEFDYLVPDQLANSVEAGRRLQVPLGRGNRTMVGYCVRVANRVVVTSKMKYVDRVLDDRPLLAPSMLEMTQWIAEYYLCSWGQVLRSVIPAGVRSYAGTREALLLSVPDKARKQIPTLKLSPQQLQILDVLLQARGPMTSAALAEAAGCTASPIQTLRKKGLIETHTERISTYSHEEARVAREDNLALNPDQRIALDAVLASLDAGEHRTLLLHGVTGSGKTEIYMQAIEHVISFGRQAIGKLTAGAVLLTAACKRPYDLHTHYQRFINLGIEIASGRLLWPALTAREAAIVSGLDEESLASQGRRSLAAGQLLDTNGESREFLVDAPSPSPMAPHMHTTLLTAREQLAKQIEQIDTLLHSRQFAENLS